MTCNEMDELLGEYFDLPEGDPKRSRVEEHILVCRSCREQFEMWSESAELIRSAGEAWAPELATASVTGSVMNRIYTDESWRIPVANRIYSIPYKLRRSLTAVIAFCLALFICSLLYAAFGNEVKEPVKHGFIPEAKATGQMTGSNLTVDSMPSASFASAKLIKPIKIGGVRTTSDYMLAFSFLGITSTLLIMNWLSRTRS